MTTTLRSALNAHPSSAPTAGPTAKQPQATPAHDVQAKVHRGQHPKAGNHRADPAWQAALQAAVGPHSHVLQPPKDTKGSSASRGQTVEAAGKSTGAATKKSGHSVHEAKVLGHDLTAGTASKKADGTPKAVRRQTLEAKESVAQTNRKPPAEVSFEKASSATGKGSAHQVSRNANPAKLPTEVAGIQRPLKHVQPASAKSVSLGTKDTKQSDIAVLKPNTPDDAIANVSNPASQPSVLSESIAMHGSGRSQTQHEAISVGSHAVGNPMSASPTFSPSGGLAPHTLHTAPASSLQSNSPSPPSSLSATSLQQLGAQIHTLHHAGGGQAEIRLDPPTLGTVSIQLNVQQNQAQVTFQAAQSATAQMLQASLPQLVHTLQQQGITLAHAQVHASSEGSSLNTGPNGFGQQPGQQSGQQAQLENARVTTTPESVGATPDPSNGSSENGVRAYA